MQVKDQILIILDKNKCIKLDKITINKKVLMLNLI